MDFGTVLSNIFHLGPHSSHLSDLSCFALLYIASHNLLNFLQVSSVCRLKQWVLYFHAQSLKSRWKVHEVQMICIMYGRYVFLGVMFLVLCWIRTLLSMDMAY